MIFCVSESCNYFCSVDLRSLVEQNRSHFIPPTSRMTNYVVFRFGNVEADYNVSMPFCSIWKFEVKSSMSLLILKRWIWMWVIKIQIQLISLDLGYICLTMI